MSYFSQMAGLAVQNFVSAAVGMAVLAAVIRGFARRSGAALGNFWQDLTRTLLYVLLPLSLVGALVLVSQGVIQTLSAYVTYATLQGASRRSRSGRSPRRRHQAARHQRRRLLQRQQRDAVREPHRLHELRGDAVDPGHPGRPHRDVRAHGRQPPSGLGHLRGDADDVRRRHRGRLRGRGRTARRPEAPGRTASPTAPRRQHRGQGAVRFGIATRRCAAAITTVASCGAVNAAIDSLTGIGGAVPLVEHDDRRGRSSAASARASTGCCSSSCSRSSSRA